MSERPPPAFLEALQAFRDALVDLGAPFTFIGGVAVIARGVPRLTVDIDATVRAPDIDVESIFRVLARHDIGPRIDDALEFARMHQVFLAIHRPTGTPIDLSLAWLDFENQAIRSSDEVDYGDVRIPVAQAEDLIVYKMVAFRPRDIDDAEKLLNLHGGGIRIARVRRLVEQFCEVLDDRARIE
ncbi:MAG TPA: nucleotidyl transferase AbiEii/AbiGii toxin family protein, partial [Vicinamibacteria bacterium]